MINFQWKREKYLTNYVFEVQFGSLKFSFSKVSNISSQTEYDVVADGGINDRMFFFEKPNRRPDTISFEHGMKVSKDTDAFLMEKGMKVYGIHIFVKKDDITERIFFIEEGVVTGISYTDLDASRGEILIKKMEMQHTGIKEELASKN